LILGNGSTEILDLVTRALIGPGDEAIISVPTYAFFGTQTRLYGGTPVLVPLAESWRFDVDGILGAIGAKTKAVFLCSPNNPTGNSLTEAELKAILEAEIPT
jgi:histidinol-phosphate aminotransferase